MRPVKIGQSTFLHRVPAIMASGEVDSVTGSVNKFGQTVLFILVSGVRIEHMVRVNLSTWTATFMMAIGQTIKPMVPVSISM
jgi:hypothetical protein